jgi:DNA-binding transcriptional LysR family regulator
LFSKTNTDTLWTTLGTASQMNDLNNILYFARIVEHGSLSAAAEALGIAKSALSNRLSRLESDLGVRLVQRTTRKLQITAVGSRYYERCRAVLSEVERAGTVIENERGVPRGTVRVACPVTFAHAILAPVVAAFLAEHEEVEVQLDTTNREVDLIGGGYDVALRIHSGIRSSTLVARSFTLASHQLVASTQLVERYGMPKSPQDLARFPAVGGSIPVQGRGRYRWLLSGPGGRKQVVTYRPRLVTEDLFVLREAVLAGNGIADLPEVVCTDALAEGSMVKLLPQWRLPQLRLYAVYASRNGQRLAVRAFIDYLAERLEPMLEHMRTKRLRISLT